MDSDQARVVRVRDHAYAVIKRSRVLRLFPSRPQAEAFAKRA